MVILLQPAALSPETTISSQREEVSSVSAALWSSTTYLSGPVPARNAGPDLLKYKNKSRSPSR